LSANMKKAAAKSKGAKMKTYVFKVVIEEDAFADSCEAYHAYCPALEEYAATTWGYTEEEAFKNIQEVVQMIIEELIEDGKPIPEQPEGDVQVFVEPRVMVIIWRHISFGDPEKDD
jgi:predicted RNase H-like HicB family nuclease